MIRHGDPPYLECSTAGDRRFSAFCARIVGRHFNSIEEIYQSSKRFSLDTPGVDVSGKMIDWKNAKGKKPLNIEELIPLYDLLWREYLAENIDLIDVILSASGLSDKFGVQGHQCQATALWFIREEYKTRPPW